jgi:hypothetical protein
VWTVSSGALPPGVSLDPPSGTLSGTPTGAADVMLGLTVTDSQGRTASQSLELRITLALTITTISPLPAAMAGASFSTQLLATGGTPPYLWSVAGVLPAGLLLNVANGVISGTPVVPGSYNFTITVTDSRQQQTASKSFIAIVSVPQFTIGGLGSTVGPAQQVAVNASIATPYTVDLSGSLTLTFTSTVGGDDPSIQFTTSGRTVSFTIPAGSTQAVYTQNQQLLLSTGTVAGTITIKATVQAGSSDITPSPAPQASTSVPKLAPVITSASLKKITGGVTVSFAGYSTTKELTQATLVFNPASGGSLTGTSVTVPLTATMSAWYQSAAAAAFGSQFVVTVPLTVQGDVSAIGSVTVTVTNTQGNSAPITASLQ